MEQRIENAIDHALEDIALQLYMFSVGAGVVLVILGIIFLAGKGYKEKKGKSNAGLICMVIGLVAIVSGIVQMF